MRILALIILVGLSLIFGWFRGAVDMAEHIYRTHICTKAL